MKKLSFALTVFVILVLVSCSTGRYVPNSNNLNLNQTQVVLSEANFRIVKHVTAITTYSRKMRFDSAQLQQSAYAALVRKADLTGSQVLINVTIEQVQRLSDLWAVFPREDNAILMQGTVIEFIDKKNAPIGPSATEVENVSFDSTSHYSTGSFYIETKLLSREWKLNFHEVFMEEFNRHSVGLKLTSNSQPSIFKLTITEYYPNTKTLKADFIYTDETGKEHKGSMQEAQTIQQLAKVYAEMLNNKQFSNK